MNQDAQEYLREYNEEFFRIDGNPDIDDEDYFDEEDEVDFYNMEFEGGKKC